MYIAYILFVVYECIQKNALARLFISGLFALSAARLCGGKRRQSEWERYGIRPQSVRRLFLKNRTDVDTDTDSDVDSDTDTDADTDTDTDAGIPIRIRIPTPRRTRTRTPRQTVAAISTRMRGYVTKKRSLRSEKPSVALCRRRTLALQAGSLSNRVVSAMPTTENWSTGGKRNLRSRR